MRARTLLITQAVEGTLFLDDIGDLSPASEVKLLRLLQDSSYYPLGAVRPRQDRAPVIVRPITMLCSTSMRGRFAKTSTIPAAHPPPPVAPAAQAPRGRAV
ncbi:MAG: sigma 54-interacting transcriptional regulator [Gammaproteobacteria bacterium]